MRLGRSWLRIVGLGLALLVTVQCVAWFVVGQRSLLKLVANDIAMAVGKGEALVSPECLDPIGDAATQRLVNELLPSYGVSVRLVETETPKDWASEPQTELADPMICVGHYSNNPLVGKLTFGIGYSLVAGTSYRSRFVFVLAFWVPIERRVITGVS